MTRLLAVALLLVALCTSNASRLSLRDQPDSKKPGGGDPLDPMTTGSMISGGAVFAELEDKPDTKGGSGGDPLDPMTTGSMISGGAVFDKPDTKGGSGGDPLDPMTTGSMISGGAVFHGDAPSDPSLVEIGPSRWVDNLIKSYMKDAKAGRMKGVGKGDVKIVDNNNSLKHEEAPEGGDAEEKAKKTQEESKKARAEQKSKEKDEAGQKKVEQSAKKSVVALKKQVAEQNIKTDREQDKKTVMEDKVKAGEADTKKGNEAKLKLRVQKLKQMAAEEGKKAERALAQKKAKEQGEKTKFEQGSKAEIQAAVASAQRERQRAAREAGTKREDEARAKKEQRERQEKEMKAEQSTKEREAKEKEEKEKEERAAIVRPTMFKPEAGRVMQDHSRLLTATQWKNAFTYTFWVRPLGIVGGWANLFHKGAANHQRNPAVWFYPGQLRLHVRSGTANNAAGWVGGSNDGCDPSESLPQNSWTWVAITHDTTAMRVMFGSVGGELRTVCTASHPPATNNGPLYVSDPWHSAGNADMSDLRVYNRVLTETELKAIVAKKSGIN